MEKIYSKEKLFEIVQKCNTYREVLIYFNRNESSRSYQQLRQKINEWGIDTSHFLNKSEHIKLMYDKGLLEKKDNSVLFVENSSCGRSTIKKRIIDECLIEYKCAICGNIGEWLGKKITLILDHINGVNNDNRLNNLRFLCPNCNATLATHCRGYVALFNKEKKKRKKPNREHLRIVNRPSYETLIDEINSLGYCGTGRKYGVSDTSIRKWVKFFETNLE
jgi:5-methylcytosine-specific restriction endonuclease McrA